MKRINKYMAWVLIVSIGFSCRKDWLDAKPDKALVVPSSLGDFQALLDNSVNTFNYGQPAFGLMSSNDYYVMYDHWTALYTNQEKNCYIWAKDIYEGSPDFGDWNISYKQIFYANDVLEGINKIEPAANDRAEWNNLKGSALFYRGYAFYNLVQTFAMPYNEATAANDLGIPLRLEADVKQKSVRASIRQTYDQLIQDLAEATYFLPVVPKYKTRPSRTAAYAMLERAFLSMDKYDKSFAYADSALQLNSSLMDFNSLDSAAGNPIARFNTEDIFHAILINYSITSPTYLIVDSTLYRGYSTNDLRRLIYFGVKAGNPTFKGSYDHTVLLFSGLATDEMYLTRAECNARKGNTNDAMKDLNTLLKSRWRAGTFIPLTASDPGEALDIILQERRKELAFRGIHWNDLRRLNKDPKYAVTLTRELNGQIYTLPPGDPRYAFPIPDNEITISGLPQNIR